MKRIEIPAAVDMLVNYFEQTRICKQTMNKNKHFLFMAFTPLFLINVYFPEKLQKDAVLCFRWDD